MASKSISRPDYKTYFDDPALVKAYYIPTELLSLTKEQKKLAMSPHRLPERESGAKQPVTPETEVYLRQSEFEYNCRKDMPTHPTPSPPSTLKFDESWPSSEPPSSLGSNLTKESCTAETQSPATDESVLSKYLRRFRNDPPLRREDRKGPSLQEFWWGVNTNGGRNTAKASSTNTVSSQSSAKATENTSSDRDFELSGDGTPRSDSSSKQKVSKRISFEPATPKTKALIEKTDELLSNSEHSEGLVSLPAVSTLDSDSTGSYAAIYHSTPEDNSDKPPLRRDRNASASSVTNKQNPRPSDERYRHKEAGSLNPDNDILYQWRLRRRLEQAQERVKAAELQAARGSLGKLREGADTSSRVVGTSVAREPRSSALLLAEPTTQQSVRRIGEAVRAVQRTAVVERVVQTDAEIVQSETQTTPTVDPISACTGLVTDLSTSTLRDRIAASASPAKFSATGCSVRAHGRCQSVCQQHSPGVERQQCCCIYRQLESQSTSGQLHPNGQLPPNGQLSPNGQLPYSRQLSPSGCPPQSRQLPQSNQCPNSGQLSNSHYQSSNTNNNCASENSETNHNLLDAKSEKAARTEPHEQKVVCVPAVPSGKTGHGSSQAAAVSEAISEVCRQRLFHLTQSPDATATQSILEPLSTSSSARTLEDCSDGEFADDEVLLALRQKRQDLERNIRRVERRLSSLASEPS